jgi:hypothetical protein
MADQPTPEKEGAAMARKRIAPKSRPTMKELPIGPRERTMLGLRVESAARRLDELRRHVLPVRPNPGPEAREAIVAAGSDVLAVLVHELEAAAMDIFGPYNAGVSRLGRAAAEKVEVA